jgi:hypothetical protein
MDVRGLESRQEQKFFLLQNFQTSSEDHTASYSAGTAALFWRESGLGMKVTTHLDLSRYRMSGAIPLLPKYASMAWTG